ncbi:hypothetical protein J4526_07055 [Desulfurococcaceae archaeon MEX13E-LK6-19]|nr:hypothetical protein J4526_07055 [Desulfurococcaceae archaeon MEX13E-LK6-19]
MPSMDLFNQLKRTRLVAIKNFDEELYMLVKTYASLEGRTIASILRRLLAQGFQGIDRSQWFKHSLYSVYNTRGKESSYFEEKFSRRLVYYIGLPMSSK